MNLLELPKDSLEAWMEEHSEKAYRASQVLNWIWEKNTLAPEKMTDLPASLRDVLGRSFSPPPNVVKVSSSKDRSHKLLIELHDGNTVEAVLMKLSDHTTLCASTQVGCSLTCTFCESGQGGLVRNLAVYEIIAQVALCVPKPRNIVFMGIGEPLLNYSNLKTAILRLTKEAGLSMRHMTISTVGIPGFIYKLAEELPKIHLAISLHAPTQRLRERLMPKAAKAMSLFKLIDEVKLHSHETGSRPTFEYIMIKDVNDSVDSANQLSDLLSGIPGLINLIPFHKVTGSPYLPSEPPAIRKFLSTLRSLGHDATVRRSLGLDTGAACGQLRSLSSEE